MRVTTYGYGNTTFDVRREFQDSKRKTKKIIAYLVLSGIVFYVVRFILQLNMSMLKDMISAMLRGEQPTLDTAYLLNKASENHVVAFIISAYYFLEKSVFSIRDYLMGLYERFMQFIQPYLEK